MSTENTTEKRVAIFEDDLDFRESLTMLLESFGYTVVAIAATFDDALDLIDRLIELEVKTVIVDGNLQKGIYNNKDGERIIQAIKYWVPEVITIGNAASRNVDGAHFNSPKADGPENLLSLLKDNIKS